jgi:NAD-dependent dihydropyrimidine dehydrogenase PreA subunit
MEDSKLTGFIRGGWDMPKVNLDSETCTQCQTCVNTCPMGVFELDSDTVVVAQEDQCIVCRACEVACPVEAITVLE